MQGIMEIKIVILLLIYKLRKVFAKCLIQTFESIIS